MIRSIELSWIARQDKSLPLPLLDFDVLPDEYGARYYPPMRYDLEFNDKVFPLDHGLIQVNTIYNPCTASSLAHEWRHHWQAYHGWKLPGHPIQASISYDDRIKRHFKWPEEKDALRFELRHTPDDRNREFMDILKGVF